jgi:NADPH:quinone reductase-like Zn-dependent oxidoreductase
MDLLVKKSALAETTMMAVKLPEIGEGEIELKVDLFSLTANNITYGAFGDFLKYWQFYPAPDAAWGRVPVWGFATVTASKSDSAKVGERVYGYLPMSTLFRLKPGARRHGGFSDESPHRAGLAAVYNGYVFSAEDPLYTADTEALQVLFRPLFTTSFLIDDFLADNGYYGAKQIVFSSASAKTSYAAAQLLKARGDVKVIGLTSPGNVAFTQALGFYDQVVPYGEIGSLDGSVPTVFVDIAGDASVRGAVHRTFADSLKYSCAVGATHWDKPRLEEKLPGPQPQMFFAPSIVQKRIADWGGVGFQQRVGEAWRAFLPTAAKVTRVVEGRGLEAAATVWADLATGKAKPDDGHVIRLAG